MAIYKDGVLVPMEVFTGEHRGELAGKPLTRQEMFDIAWRHAVVDKQPYSEVGGFCRYRKGESVCCLVGAMIPDKIYRDIFEQTEDEHIDGQNPTASALSGILIHKGVELFDVWDKEFADALQSLHDYCTLTEGEEYLRNIHARLINFAALYDLTIPEEANVPA